MKIQLPRLTPSQVDAIQGGIDFGGFVFKPGPPQPWINPSWFQFIIPAPGGFIPGP